MLNYSVLNVKASDKIDKRQRRRLLECLDYMRINASILGNEENEDIILLLVDSVDLLKVKRSKKVTETFLAGAIAQIDTIGGIPYKEYMYNAGY